MVVVIVIVLKSLSPQSWACCRCLFNAWLQSKSWPFAFSDVQIFRQAEQLEFALNWWAQLWSQAKQSYLSVNNGQTATWAIAFCLADYLCWFRNDSFFPFLCKSLAQKHCSRLPWGGQLHFKERGHYLQSEYGAFEHWLEEKFRTGHEWLIILIYMGSAFMH